MTWGVRGSEAQALRRRDLRAFVFAATSSCTTMVMAVEKGKGGEGQKGF